MKALFFHNLSRDLDKTAQLSDKANIASKQVWGPWATAGFGPLIGVVMLLVVGLTTLVYVAVGFAAQPAQNFSQYLGFLDDTVGLFLSITTFTTTIVCIGLIVIIIKLKKGTSISEYLGLRRITWKTAIILLAITAGIAIVSDALATILGQETNPEFEFHVIDTSIWPALLVLAVVVFGPVSEEAFFRGFLFEGFRRSRLGVAGAVVLLAFVWSLLHFEYGLYWTASIFVTGIALGIARARTNSLLSPLLMHMFMNVIATLELVFKIG